MPRVNAAEFGGDGSHLARYARVMNCAEINSSFYRSHQAATWLRWADSVPQDFRFAVKAPKAITHEKELACEASALRAFLNAARLLGPKLGPILFQLPPSFAFDAAKAKDFFAMLREEYAGRVALEPRHATWFSGEVDELLRTFNIARVAADPARVAEAAKPAGDLSLAYFRLHGSPRMYYSHYDEEFLARIAAEIVNSPAEEKWCIFDNTAAGAALGNALKLMELISR